jgi:HD-GYP domain-containing protein (c-di-GMP phosphodiesterase class II)
MAGVSMTLGEKPGPLTAGEWERARLHAYFTERILARPRGLARLGAVATLHHERLDGSGYHRGVPAALQPPVARVLAVIEVYRSMGEARAYRAAHPPDAIAAELQRAVRVGWLDAAAVDAVLAVAGYRRPRGGPAQVAGLSGREIEVLRLLARGHSNRQIAHQLAISPATVDHHIRHIYTKIDVSTRPAATLFALQHSLVGPADAE